MDHFAPRALSLTPAHLPTSSRLPCHSIKQKVISLTLSAIFLAISGCQEKQTVNLNNTIDSVPLDHIIPLTKLVPRLSGTACILYPYQDRLPDEAPDSTIINRYLADIQFNGNESHWSLVIVYAGGIDVMTNKRSKKLDILATHEAARIPNLIPDRFVPSSCLPIEKAGFLKLEYRNRVYVIMGESK